MLGIETQLGQYSICLRQRVRAIEEGITVIRVANTGISSVVSPSGKYLNKLLLEKEGIIDINFVKKSHPTLFAVYGNFIYIILSFLCYWCLGLFLKIITLRKDK